MTSRTLRALALGLTVLLPSGARSADAGDWIDRIARALGISKTPSHQKAPVTWGAAARAGGVYVAELDGNAPRRIASSEYRSPVFLPDGEALLALSGSRLVRLSVDGAEPEPLHAECPDAVKLLGVVEDDPNEVLVLVRRDGQPGVVSVSLSTGAITPVPHDRDSADQRRFLAYLWGDARTLSDAELWTSVQRRRRHGVWVEWTDVLVEKGGLPPLNVSRCEGDDCIEPALSPGADLVAFVRVRRPGASQ